MKKLFIIPALLLFMSANPRSVEATPDMKRAQYSPITTKLDSVNLKAAELKVLLQDHPEIR